jgi:hypothetical protein
MMDRERRHATGCPIGYDDIWRTLSVWSWPVAVPDRTNQRISLVFANVFKKYAVGEKSSSMNKCNRLTTPQQGNNTRTDV